MACTIRNQPIFRLGRIYLNCAKLAGGLRVVLRIEMEAAGVYAYELVPV